MGQSNKKRKPQVCRVCGAPVPNNCNFCYHCFTPLEGGKIVESVDLPPESSFSPSTVRAVRRAAAAQPSAPAYAAPQPAPTNVAPQPAPAYVAPQPAPTYVAPDEEAPPVSYATDPKNESLDDVFGQNEKKNGSYTLMVIVLSLVIVAALGTAAYLLLKSNGLLPAFLMAKSPEPTAVVQPVETMAQTPEQTHSPDPTTAPTPEETAAPAEVAPMSSVEAAALAENAANAANYGLFCAYDGKIYYRTGVFKESSGSSYGLYCLDESSGTTKQITSNPAWCVGVDGEYVYSYNHRDNGRLNRLRLSDGTVTKLTKDAVKTSALLGEALYYSTSSATVRMKRDGGNSETVAAFASKCFSVDGDTAYFVRESDGALYAYSPDGKLTHVAAVGKVMNAVALDGTIYYTAFDGGKGGALHSYTLASGENVTLVSDPVSEFTLDGETIFYVSRNDKNRIYSWNIASGSGRRIGEHSAIRLCSVSDWLYFVNIDDETNDKNDTYALWRVKKDGTQDGKLTW